MLADLVPLLSRVVHHAAHDGPTHVGGFRAAFGFRIATGAPAATGVLSDPDPAARLEEVEGHVDLPPEEAPVAPTPGSGGWLLCQHLPPVTGTMSSEFRLVSSVS